MFPFQAVSWVELFLSLGGKCVGYEKARITPYIHAMVYHVPKFMRLHSGIKKFTGQGKIGTIKSVFTNGQSRKDPYSPSLPPRKLLLSRGRGELYFFKCIRMSKEGLTSDLLFPVQITKSNIAF